MTRHDHTPHTTLVVLHLWFCYLTLTLNTKCGEPGLPSHGKISNRTDGEVEYQCHPGHVLAGGHTRRQCHQEAGHWTGMFCCYSSVPSSQDSPHPAPCRHSDTGHTWPHHGCRHQASNAQPYPHTSTPASTIWRGWRSRRPTPGGEGSCWTELRDEGGLRPYLHPPHGKPAWRWD